MSILITIILFNGQRLSIPIWTTIIRLQEVKVLRRATIEVTELILTIYHTFLILGNSHIIL
jgi:hypothetical protein